jgi:hypothetical protein
MPGSEARSVGASVERRSVARIACDFPITITWGAATLQGNVADISVRGMFVELDDPLWIGARFAAQLALEKAVNLECVVRRVQPLRGMALIYVVPDEAERAVVASAIERLSRL